MEKAPTEITLTTLRSVLFLTVIATIFGACSNSGSGSNSNSDPQIGATVPNGSGDIPITMPGNWQIQNAEVIETNSATPAPPINGSVFVVDIDRLVSISGLLVDPESLSNLLGSPLDSYVNLVTDSTIFYGVIVDRRSQGESREEVALAGGSLDADTIMVEAYISSQEPGDSEATYTLSQYQLGRIGSSTPLGLLPESNHHSDHDSNHRSVQSLLQDAFGRR